MTLHEGFDLCVQKKNIEEQKFFSTSQAVPLCAHALGQKMSTSSFCIGSENFRVRFELCVAIEMSTVLGEILDSLPLCMGSEGVAPPFKFPQLMELSVAIKTNVSESLLEIPSKLPHCGGSERVLLLSEELRQMLCKITTGVRQSTTFIDGHCVLCVVIQTAVALFLDDIRKSLPLCGGSAREPSLSEDLQVTFVDVRCMRHTVRFRHIVHRQLFLPAAQLNAAPYQGQGFLHDSGHGDDLAPFPWDGFPWKRQKLHRQP